MTPTRDKKRYRSRSDPPPARKPTSAEITGWVGRWSLTLPLPEDERLTAAYDDRVIAAIKACRHGSASSEQQQLAMEWIVWAAGTYHETYRRDPYAHAKLAGRRSLGNEVVKLINSRTPSQDDREQG
jgi:hypothetical protein